MKKIIYTILFLCGALPLWAQAESASFKTDSIATSSEGLTSSPLVFITIIFIVVMFLWFLWYANINLWLKAKASKVIIGTHELALMRYKGVPPKVIVNHMIKAKEAQLDLPQEDLVSLYIAAEKEDDKGAVVKVVNAMIMAYNAGLQLKLKELVKQYLAKVDIEKVIKSLILAHNSHIQTTLKELSEYYLAHVNIEELIEIYIKAMSAHMLTVTMKNLVHYHHAKVNIKELVDALVIAKDGGLIYKHKRKLVEDTDQKHNDRTENTGRTNGHQNKKQDNNNAHQKGEDAHGEQHHTAHINPQDKKDEQTFLDTLVEHHHSGGSMRNVVTAVVSAKNADSELDDPKMKLDLSLEAAMNIDLAGVDLLKAVNEAIKFKVVETEPIRAYAGDGIELTMKCRVTIRPKIRRIIKGAGEDTILARINENIVTQIGLTRTHRLILESPYKLADDVEKQKELFEDTAYDLISIDISDVEVGNDIEAKLKSLKAKADYEEERVRRLHIESEVSKAMADAFRDGSFSVKDYYKLKNKEADTKLRDSLSKNKQQDDTDLAL